MKDYENDLIQLLTDWVNDRSCLNDNGEFISPIVDQYFSAIEENIGKLADLID